MKEFPTRDQILDWIRENPGTVAKRDIARAFGIKGADRIILKALLRELQDEGVLTRKRRSFRDAASLPPVAMLVVGDADADGELTARPLEWSGEDPAPRILIEAQKGDPALGPGDRILARIAPPEDPEEPHLARLIRRIGAGPRKILGIFQKTERGGRITGIEKGSDLDWLVPAGETGGAEQGELVEAEAMDGPRLGLPRARVTARLGDPGAPRSVSLIAIRQHGLPVEFSDAAEEEARAAVPVSLGTREDLRHLPLITIDPSDARDHDDAVCALPDPDPGNPGGWVVWVAIADVAHYVAPGSALDRDARLRGNSTYFPDRVVPMLPETLSADLCSLLPGVDRPCLAVAMVLDSQGNRRGHRFTRGLMRSPAGLSYEQAQAAAEGMPDATSAASEAVVRDLFVAWTCAWEARERRQPLDLDLPERRIVLSPGGEVTSVAFRERLDAHRVIEEFMILANVCAAETLEARHSALLYRVHEEPSPEKIEALREVAEGCGFGFPKGEVLKTAQFNRLLAQARDSDFAEMLNLSVLRSQTQAYYSPQNFSHFGLNLAKYAHFTSPIRRYSDLIVHRALIAAHRWGRDGLTPDEVEGLEATAKHISMTERRSMEAERDTTDRYLASFLADRIGSDFAGRVAGVARFGLFVKLDDTGADGLIPISTLGREYFHFDAVAQTLTGEDSRRVIGLGMRVTVRLAEAVPVTGGLIFELLTVDGAAAAGPRRPTRGGGGPRKPVKARVKARGIAAKAKRRH